jgi:hypothetical protein
MSLEEKERLHKHLSRLVELKGDFPGALGNAQKYGGRPRRSLKPSVKWKELPKPRAAKPKVKKAEKPLKHQEPFADLSPEQRQALRKRLIHLAELEGDINIAFGNKGDICFPNFLRRRKNSGRSSK